jgi:hypothetical protein
MEGTRGLFLNQEAALFAAQPLEEHHQANDPGRYGQQQRNHPEEMNSMASMTADLTHPL